MKLIPELRFPEFKDEGEWDENILGHLGHFLGGGTPERSNIDYWTGDIPWISSSDINDGDIHTISITRFINEKALKESATKIIPKGSVLFVSRVGVGKLAINEKELCTSQDFTSFVPKKCILNFFVGYYFSSNKNLLQSLNQGTSIKGFSKSDLEKFKLIHPKKYEEQQKIAACLSSLDEVIETNSQKLELLQAHKKGLMQNLFPQEGEKVPKFRFREFEKDGGWEEKTLGDIGEPLMCKRILKEQTTNNPIDGVPFYKIGTFGKEPDSYIPDDLYQEFKRKFSFPKIGEILISAAGTIGRLVVYNGEPAYFQDSNIVWLGNNEKEVSNSFLFYCYSRLKWQTSDGGIISRLYNSDLKSMRILFPKNKDEQQKIASCLSALDELIKVTSNKIDQLKLHKKGLMQSLFPTMNH